MTNTETFANGSGAKSREASLLWSTPTEVKGLGGNGSEKGVLLEKWGQGYRGPIT